MMASISQTRYPDHKSAINRNEELKDMRTRDVGALIANWLTSDDVNDLSRLNSFIELTGWPGDLARTAKAARLMVEHHDFIAKNKSNVEKKMQAARRKIEREESKLIEAIGKLEGELATLRQSTKNAERDQKEIERRAREIEEHRGNKAAACAFDAIMDDRKTAPRRSIKQ